MSRAYSDRVAESINVLIVDDHLAVAESLQALLSRQSDLDVGEVARTPTRRVTHRGRAKQPSRLQGPELSGESGVVVASMILAVTPGPRS